MSLSYDDFELAVAELLRERAQERAALDTWEGEGGALEVPPELPKSWELAVRFVAGIVFAALTEGDQRERFLADAIEAGGEALELLDRQRAKPYAYNRSAPWRA